MKTLTKDQYRHLDNREYNILLSFSGRESESPSTNKALNLYYMLVKNGYSKEAAAKVIKETFKVDVDTFKN